MAKTANPAKKRQRAKSGLLTRVLILILLVGICAQLYTLRGQVERAQTDQERLAAQVDAQRQANDSLGRRHRRGNHSREDGGIGPGGTGPGDPG